MLFKNIYALSLYSNAGHNMEALCPNILVMITDMKNMKNISKIFSLKFLSHLQLYNQLLLSRVQISTTFLYHV